MFAKITALAAATHLLTASAHMFISSPSPIPGSDSKSPLNADGSNFPCQGVSLPTSNGIKMPAGSSQLLAWNLGDGANWAVHGGGSCQISITYETDPQKVKLSKNWFVIYSIEGGCPSNTLLNLDGPGAWPCTNSSTNGVDCVNQFHFTIPKGVKNGHAIIAWTWYNNVGNRELYMNCVNVQLTGGDGSEMDKFPTMFVANIDADGKSLEQGSQCVTPEDVNVQFPYPGKYVTTKTAAGGASNYPTAKPTGANCIGKGAPASGDGGADSGPSPSPSSYSKHSAPAPSATVGSSASLPSYAPQPTASSSSPSSGGCIAPEVPCPTPGLPICVGKYEFGLCNQFNCALPQPLAPGTHCQGAGQILKRSHIRHAARHGAALPLV